jgi:arginyl-tRNA synthetase
MISLLQKLSDTLGAAFAAEGLDAAFGQVRFSDRPDLAQFQCNGAMAAAKAAKKNPRQVADSVVARIKDDPQFAKVEIAGPGFINLNLTDAALGAHLKAMAEDKRLGVPEYAKGETIVLDYGGPNVAKSMHVGHLRSSIIGDSVRRILQFAGYSTIGDIHLGDWGTQNGMVISELEMRHPDWVYFDPNFTGPYPEDSPVSMADLEEIYPAASKACKEDEARLLKAQQATVELQNKRPGYYALWQHMVAISIESMKGNFEALNVHFDLWKGESSVHDRIEGMVAELKKKNFAIVDDGATIVPVKRNDDDKEYPPLILYKRDGAVMYGTTDLATIAERMEEFSPAKIVYVVDQRQNLHFEQVFRAARMTGIAPDAIELTHAGFGTMNGTDGKPFKTRAGGVMRLEDLIAMGIEKAQERLKEANLGEAFSDEEKAAIAMKVAIAAIKFADLQNNRIADYVFDLDRLTRFEGKTGPYLLYQAVRIKSLLEKAGVPGDTTRTDILPGDADRALVLTLTQLPEVIEAASRSYMPHILCDHVYTLAQAFSTFYAGTHILSETDEAKKTGWLFLCSLTLRQIKLLLSLIGVDVPKRM